MKKIQTQVLIIGAGPAGLAAAIHLRKSGVQVLVVDREAAAGGMPRFCHHFGFGIGDLHRVKTGPGYARHYVVSAERLGVDIRTFTTIIEWSGPNKCVASSPYGLHDIEAQAILLATGCRERPRSARLIAGARPSGVFTTGSLQDFVHRHHSRIGKKAVVVGAELVAMSAAVTLARARCRTVAMITDLPRHQVAGIYRPAATLITHIWPRTLMTTNSVIDRIIGRHHVEAVDIKNKITGSVQTVPCDAVVFTGDWIPDHELARRAGIDMNSKTLGPVVDTQLATSQPGLFAAGNLLRGAETADRAALEGVYAAKAIHRYLSGQAAVQQRIPILVDPPMKWISPDAVSWEARQAPTGRFCFRVQKICQAVKIQVLQKEQILHEQSFSLCIPNHSYYLQDHWLVKVRSEKCPLQIRMSCVEQN